MKEKDLNSDAMPFKNIGTFWEPLCDNNGFLLEPIFTLLPSCPDARFESGFARRHFSVKLELPPTSNGMRRFLHGYPVRGGTDVVLKECVAMTCNSVLRYLGTVKVPKQYVFKIIH
ncbi:uncharacterized protein LOC111082255 [Drosophila obscura]|uniref:uncharacterized protein LOC111082255 n=1 Tax=Drosophila obscura TaxID=7282 RepID=UPI001BB2AA8A|nr:uncharacterized protein LOC111082255 [Drosophila obscura]